MSLDIRKSKPYGHFTVVLHGTPVLLQTKLTNSLSFALMAAHGDLRQEHCSIKIKLCADIRNKAAAFITLFVPNNCAYTIAIAIDEDCLKLKDSRLDL